MDGWMGPAKRGGTEAGGGGRRCDVTHDSDGHQRADWDEGVAGRAIAAGPRALRPGRWNGPPPLMRGRVGGEPSDYYVGSHWRSRHEHDAPSHIPRRRQASVAATSAGATTRSTSTCGAARGAARVPPLGLRARCGGCVRGAARAAPRCGHRGRSATCWLPTNRAEQHCRRTQRFALPTHTHTRTHTHTHTHTHTLRGGPEEGDSGARGCELADLTINDPRGGQLRLRTAGGGVGGLLLLALPAWPGRPPTTTCRR